MNDVLPPAFAVLVEVEAPVMHRRVAAHALVRHVVLAREQVAPLVVPAKLHLQWQRVNLLVNGQSPA